MKTKNSTSNRDAFAAWMITENFYLTDLEASDQASLVKALITPRRWWWWHDEVGMNGEPIPLNMVPLETAVLMLTGWHITEHANRAIAAATSRAGQTFSAGRNISAALDILKRRSNEIYHAGRSDDGFSFSECGQGSFIDLQTARRLLRQANSTEHFLSEPIELLLRDVAFVADLMPTYAQLQAENAELSKKLLQINTSHKAATVRRATRMLEALKALDEFARDKWGKRSDLLERYEKEVVRDLPRAAHLKVPTREELEGWIKDRSSKPRAGS